MINVINLTVGNLIKIKKNFKNINFLIKKKIIFDFLLINKNIVISVNNDDLIVIRKKIKKEIKYINKCYNFSLIGEKIKSNIFKYLDIIKYLKKKNIKVFNFSFSEFKLFFSIKRKNNLNVINYLRKRYKL